MKSPLQRKKILSWKEKGYEQAGEKRIKKMVTLSETYTTFTASNLSRADFLWFPEGKFLNQSKERWRLLLRGGPSGITFVSNVCFRLLTVQAACGPLFGQVSWAGFVRCCPGLFWFSWCTNRHIEDLSLILSGSTAVTPPLSLNWPPDLTVVPH